MRKLGNFDDPVAPRPCTVQKSRPSQKLSGPWTTMWSGPYISAMRPVDCRAVWPFQLWGFFGSKWSQIKSSLPLFRVDMNSRMVTKFCENRQLGSCPKVISFWWQKTPEPSKLQILPYLADHAHTFANVVAPWPVYVYRIWLGSTAICRSYSRKNDCSDHITMRRTSAVSSACNWEHWS